MLGLDSSDDSWVTDKRGIAVIAFSYFEQLFRSLNMLTFDMVLSYIDAKLKMK